jgi:AcrR family transcriptional regulator
LRHSRSKSAPVVAISPRKSPQQERSQVTVDAIMTAAAQVLVRDGYGRANTGLIAQAAGVSIGSVYQYFPNKDAIFSELLRRELDAIVMRTAAALSAAIDGSLAERVRAAVGAILASKAENPDLHRVLKTELGRLDGARLLKALNRRSLELTADVLAAHRTEIHFAEPARAAFLVVNAIEGVVQAIVAESPGSLGDPAVADELTAMVLAFLRASPGRRD